MVRMMTMHLSDGQGERLERFARDHGAEPAEAGVRLIDEALRMADHPLIEFRDSLVGRQAYVRGSSLAVWEVMMLLRERGHDVQKTASYLMWPLERVEAALSYAQAYPNEIDTALSENDAFDADTLRRLLPQTRVVDIDMAEVS